MTMWLYGNMTPGTDLMHALEKAQAICGNRVVMQMAADIGEFACFSNITSSDGPAMFSFDYADRPVVVNERTNLSELYEQIMRRQQAH